jgi:hypothetical protein
VQCVISRLLKRKRVETVHIRRKKDSVIVRIRRKRKENATHCPATWSVRISDYTGEICTAWTFCGKRPAAINVKIRQFMTK